MSAMSEQEPTVNDGAEHDGRRPDRRRSAAAERRRAREAAIIAATRSLLDARGVRDAQIEDVARAVGVNRAIIYRHFTGKEELFALTLVGYLRELHQALVDADDPDSGPEERLRRSAVAFLDYGRSHPAFVDCGVTILRSGPELLEEISPSALFRLGRAMTSCLAGAVAILREGMEQGVFDIEDPDLVANTTYAMGLGGLQLSRLGVVVREDAPGVPAVVPVAPGQVTDCLVEAMLSLARAKR
jgi:AcrR family transcriptional regulator